MNMVYTKDDIEKYKVWLRENLTDEKYIHSLGVMNEAKRLANQFGLNENLATVAGLLHDCAKCFSKEKLINIINNEIKEIDICQLKNHKTYHAPAGAWVCKNYFNIKNEQILSSISNHTIANLHMSDFDKLIFIADKIEPTSRDHNFRESVLEQLEMDNGINRGFLMCIKQSLFCLIRKNLKICETTIDVYNDLVNRINNY